MFARLVLGPMVRWFARPYVAGDTLESALDVAAGLHADHGFLTSLDLLGEDVHRQSEVDATVDVYERLVDAVAADARYAGTSHRPSISLKPSAFTTGEIEAVRDPLRALARRCHEHGIALTIDMEDRRWTDLTIDLTVELFEAGLDVGTVLQTRLHRTEADLARIPEGMRLRLVIGIYNEPADIALTAKRPMKERMLDYAHRLLDRNVFVEFGTHDEEFLERFVKEVAPAAPERCEIQMIYGVPRRKFAQRLKAGDLGTVLPLRKYVPFAEGWTNATDYLRRRMEESPNMVWLVLRNLVSRR